MTVLAPLYLLALLPFAAFAAWLLVGRRRRTWVPFLPLWDAPEELRKPKKGFEPPPISIVFILLALLLALLAAARPELGGSKDRGRVTIVIDRGATMSALTAGHARFADLARSAAPALAEVLGPGAVNLVDGASGAVTKSDRAAWARDVAAWKRTALDTAAALRPIVRQLVDRGEPTIVLSDADLGFTHDQLVQISPDRPIDNAAIVSLAERPNQVMATVRSTLASSRLLTVRAGPATATRQLDLKSGVDQHVFLDLTAATADTIEASLDGRDDFDGDDRAWLVRRGNWPVLEPRTTPSPELRRMLDVYARHRPPADNSPRLAVGRPADVRGDEPGVILPDVDPAESPRGEVRVVAADHPTLAGVDWAALAQGAAVATKPPGEGWTTLATLANRPILAARDGDVRQLWVGFESRPFARGPAFVVFWTNAFDWAGSGVAGFTAARIGDVPTTARRLAPDALPADADPARWPGVFQGPTGPLAANAPPITFRSPSPAAASTWQSQLSRLRLASGAGIELTRWLALAALAFAALAAATWERRRAPRAHAPEHLDVEAVKHVETVLAADGHVHRHETEARRQSQR